MQDLVKSKKYLSKAYNDGHQETINALAQISEIKLIIDESKRQRQAKVVSPIPAPKGEMEVIQVTAPSLEEVFTYHIALLRMSTPDGLAATGTYLRRRTCGEIISCNVEADRERIRDFLMSTW